MTASSVISIRDQGALDLVRSLLEQGISVRIRVSGRSMQPLLNGGETVEVAPLAAQHPKNGDIVLFCDRKGNPLVHRLLRRRYYNGILHLQTKGDACAGFDSFVPAEQVLGRAVRIFGQFDKAIDLRKPFMRYQGRLVVTRTLLLYYLLRVTSAVKKLLIPPSEFF